MTLLSLTLRPSPAGLYFFGSTDHTTCDLYRAMMQEVLLHIEYMIIVGDNPATGSHKLL